MQRNRFPHSASSQDADGFCRHHIETDVVEHTFFSESLRHVLEFDVRPRFFLRNLFLFFVGAHDSVSSLGSWLVSIAASSNSSGVFKFRNICPEKPASDNSSGRRILVSTSAN